MQLAGFLDELIIAFCQIGPLGKYIFVCSLAMFGDCQQIIDKLGIGLMPPLQRLGGINVDDPLRDLVILPEQLLGLAIFGLFHKTLNSIMD